MGRQQEAVMMYVVRAMSFHLRFALFACLTVACGGGQPAAASPDATPSSSAVPAPSEPPAEPPQPPKRRKPFEVYNSCSDVVTVVFDDNPKAGGGRTIAPSASIEGPRDGEGNQTVWLLDAGGEPLVKVHVTRGMKRVEIGKSCRTLDAR